LRHSVHPTKTGQTTNCMLHETKGVIKMCFKFERKKLDLHIEFEKWIPP